MIFPTCSRPAPGSKSRRDGATRREEDRNEGGGEGQIKAGSVALLPPPRSNFPPCQTAAGVCNPRRRRGPRFSNGCRPRPARGRLHVLRHTFCSRLAMRAATVKAVQELAGHASLMTTQRYMHLSPAAKASAIRLLESDRPRAGRDRGEIAGSSSASDEIRR